MLRSIDWYLVGDVSGQLVGLIFKDQAVQQDCLILEDKTDKLSRNFGNKLPIYIV
jgi:hypothetical protein